MAGKGGILIVLLLLCSGCLCISSVASAGGVLVARPMDGDVCEGDDENAEFIVDKGECTFVMCAPGYELNSKGVCAIPTGEVGDKEGFMAPGSVTGVVGEGGNTDPNPDDCGGNWSEWGECTGGKQSRYWTTTKLPRGGGAPCPTLTQEMRDCGGQDSGAGTGSVTSMPTLLDGEISWQGGGHSEQGGLIWLNTGSAPWNKMYKFRCEKNGEVSEFTQEFGPVSHYNWINPKVRVARDGQRPCPDDSKLQIFEGATDITSQVKNFDQVTSYDGYDRAFTDTR